ncbi:MULTISPECIES: hypothetical protein [unclassified Arthrobacter]|uniref:hypothetical protein n=1 Tax=Micrococcaceae TaxID=1268 RepID=UPI0006F89E68|nr:MULTISPECIES: hypothetical protein [unclassified Arthrobacter]KRE66657.1 hypothetical protein ASG79_11055 [Arthrobacter sp. Soil761]TWD53104.1 hypothetical protein FB478_104245 [Arthrobacter sp. AG367]
MADRTTTSRSGNLGSAIVNALLLYGINMWPGWQVLPFLTADMSRVLDLINASLIAGIIVNLVCVVIHARTLVALGNLVVIGFGVAAMLRLWEVFPFDFGTGWSGWPVLVRVLLVLGIVGSAIGAVVEVVNLFRALAGLEPRAR